MTTDPLDHPAETVARVATALVPVLRDLAVKRDGAAKRELLTAATALERAVWHLRPKPPR
jgi:hypothetical protein